MHLYQMTGASFFGAPFQAIEEWLIEINCLNWYPKLARQHHCLTAGTATRVNNNFKPMLWQRSQNIQSKAVVAWTQLVHICEKDVNWIWSLHPARRITAFLL